MDDSDDYGISDDETAFFAVATQVEAQHAAFDPSPRPSKRARLSHESPTQDDDHFNGSAYDDSRDQCQVTSTSRSRKSVNYSDTDEEGYYFDGELGRSEEEERKAKLARYKIYMNKDAVKLPNVFMTQTQFNLDEDPAAIRGPIWKKPSAIPPPPLFNNSEMARPPNAVVNSAHSETPVNRLPAMNSLDAYVQRSGGSNLARTAQRTVRNSVKDVVKPRVVLQSQQEQENLGITRELEEAFDDDFGSSFGDELDLNTTRGNSRSRPSALRGPQNGLKQMTIFGQPATQALTCSQAAKKRHAWPVAARDAAPTHHKLDSDALKTWTYPTNLGTVRDYQYNIVSRSLFHNTLVALPTGLGKTFIAATIMLNYFRWTTDAQMIFMAPTKPLIAQQMEACYGIVGIPRRDTVLMTGETTPAIRAEEWLEKRVFFMTPQTVINDLKTGICDPKRVVLIVVDEAHKATGAYAYTEVVSFLRRFNQSFRVLALTATPGSTTEAVQAVIENLGIARVELRTEASLDIRQYTHEKQTDTHLFNWSEEQTMIMGHMSKAIQPVLDKLSGQNAYWSRDPMALSPFGLLQARQKWVQSDAGRKATMPIKGMVQSIFTVLSSLAHGLNMLKFHGIGPFFASMREFQSSDEGGAKKKYVQQIVESDAFTRAMSHMRAWSNNIDFMGHPKLEYLREVIMNHFLDAGEGQPHGTNPPRATRVMIFSSFRASTEEICKVLKRNEPLIRPHVFVGQSSSKNSEGMDQKKQNAVIQDFKDGKYNTLVATSIGEEGLDIGDVDLIICYDASSSPIRMLQRIGRTGRKRVGKVVLLLMRGKEENDYIKAQDSYVHIQKTIADESQYTYRDDQNPRILPREVQPVVDKRVVDIPVENSQPIDLNERARRRKGKGKPNRPAKKFHMPDGVITGFVKASALDEDESEDGGAPARRRKSTKGKAITAEPLPEPACIPFLDDVLLTPAQLQDHERKYAYVSGEADDIIVEPPDPYCRPDLMRTTMPTKYISHGRYAKLVTDTLSTIHEIDDTTVDQLKAVRQPLAMELSFAVRAREVAVAEAVEHAELSDAPTLPGPAMQTTRKMQAARKPKPTKASLPKQAAKQERQPIARANTYQSDAMEASDSEPDPTPADMRLATQGIDLGSHDTSGEDEDEEPDSELDQFIANSDDPIEMLSSSVPGSQHIRQQRRRLQKRKAPAAIFSSYDNNDSDEIMNDVDEDTDDAINEALRGKKTKRVVESDSDE